MKPTDLMVGDWVKWKDKYVQIAAISGIVYSFGHIYVEIAHCGSGLIERHDLKSISPIPLTPEILELNEFIHVYTGSIESKYYKHIVNEHSSTAINVYFLKDMDVKVLVQIETNLKAVSGVNSIHNCEIESAHQLQHALRLCGLNDLADNLKLEE